MASRRPRSDPWQTWLGESLTPLYVVDASYTLRTFNAGCVQLTGWNAEELIGELCRFSTAADPQTIAALLGTLCPPPEVWRGEELSVPMYLTSRQGVTSSRILRFWPLGADRQRPEAVLGMIDSWQPPVTRPVMTAQALHTDLSAIRARHRSRFSGQLIATERHPAMALLLSQIALAQQSDAFLLLEGEPGTGKEHLARLIHFGGPAKAQWFVPLDCARLLPDELERVLTRLVERHEPPPAQHPLPLPGTVFLSDCERLPRELQQLLVSTWQKEASQRPRLRFFGATGEPLERAVERGQVLPAFASLMSVLTLRLPPLRERRDDLPRLAQHFLEEANRQRPHQVSGFSDEALELILEYRYPGNLDELARLMREAHERCAETVIRPADLPLALRSGIQSQQMPAWQPASPIRLDELLEQFERRLLSEALTRCQDNKSLAAEMLGINRPRLYRRLQQLGLIEPNPDADSRSDQEPASSDDPPQ